MISVPKFLLVSLFADVAFSTRSDQFPALSPLLFHPSIQLGAIRALHLLAVPLDALVQSGMDGKVAGQQPFDERTGEIGEV